MKIRGVEIKFTASFYAFWGTCIILAFFLNGKAVALEYIRFLLISSPLVFFHEWAHILMAERFGSRGETIYFHMFGCLAKIDNLPTAPKAEFLIALAGPAFNLVLAGGALLCGVQLHSGFTGLTFWQYFVNINLVIGLINLIPMFPADGGRMLRSTLAWLTGSRSKATRYSFYVACALSVPLLIYTASHLMISAMVVIPILLFACYFEMRREEKLVGAT